MRFLTLLALAAAACVSADSIPESFRQNYQHDMPIWKALVATPQTNSSGKRGRRR